MPHGIWEFRSFLSAVLPLENLPGIPKAAALSHERQAFRSGGALGSGSSETLFGVLLTKP